MQTGEIRLVSLADRGSFVVDPILLILEVQGIPLMQVTHVGILPIFVLLEPLLSRHEYLVVLVHHRYLLVFGEGQPNRVLP